MRTAEKISVEPPRGMRDFLPQQAALRDWASGLILETYKKFGFVRIETPVLENVNLLRGAEGGENLQLIYEVLKRGEKLDKELEKSGSEKIDKDALSDLGLRFDLTVPLVRYFSANQNELPYPLKAIQIGSVFRAESPQKGRFRQFTQCDIDIIGVKSELAEMELITATAAALVALGFNGFSIHINDRRFLSELAQTCGFTDENMGSCFIALDKLDKIGLAKVKEELLSDSRNSQASVHKICSYLEKYLQIPESKQGDLDELIPVFGDLLKSDHMGALSRIVDALSKNAGSQYKLKFDPTLVRGMGYYTGPIFEAKYPGYSGSIAGGGRYDKMVGKFSGRDLPACGFSIGFERIVDILSQKGFMPEASAKRIALLVDPDRDAGALVLQAAAKLREGEEFDAEIVSIQARKKDMKKQLDSFVQQGFTHYCPFRGELDNLELKELASKQ